MIFISVSTLSTSCAAPGLRTLHEPSAGPLFPEWQDGQVGEWQANGPLLLQPLPPRNPRVRSVGWDLFRECRRRRRGGGGRRRSCTTWALRRGRLGWTLPRINFYSAVPAPFTGKDPRQSPQSHGENRLSLRRHSRRKGLSSPLRILIHCRIIGFLFFPSWLGLDLVFLGFCFFVVHVFYLLFVLRWSSRFTNFECMRWDFLCQDRSSEPGIGFPFGFLDL